MSAHLRPGPTRRPWTAALAAAALGLLATTATALPGETGRIAFSRDGDVWVADADGTDAVQITSGPEDDRWPRWSPEGNRIAVVRNGDLTLLRATGARLRRLTTHGDVVAAPSWSPDGRYIAYVHAGGGIAIVDATQADSNGTPHELGTVTSVAWNPLDADQIAYTEGGAVFTARPDGSEAGTEIVPPDPEGRTRDELAWDPGSGQVVFASTGADGTRIDGAGVSIEGGEGDDRSPAWSADGQHMFFSRGDTLHAYQRDPFPEGSHIRSLRLDGATPDGQPSLISSAAAYETDTGTQLFFRIRPVGRTPIIVKYETVSGAGSATEGSDYVAEAGEVTTPDAFANAAAISVPLMGDVDHEPDETFFVDFTFPSDPAARLRVRGTILNDDPVRNGVITYTDGQGVAGLDPVRGVSEPIVPGAGSAVYSPGGDRLAFLRVNAGEIQLVVADASGAPQVTFPLSAPIDHEIVWSPDGARLAWTQGAALWMADPTNPARAVPLASDAVTPSWSSDPGPGPRRLAFARISTGMVCTVKTDGTGESCLTGGSQPRWSPDDTTIAFLRGAAVFLMNPDGTNERLAVSIGGSPDARLLRWSPRGGSFAFMTDSALFIGQEGSPPLSVAGLPASLGSFDWSPDGNQLVAQGAGPGESQLWIVGPDDAGTPFAAARQVTAAAGGAVEPRWSSVAVRPTATLASRGGIERFVQARVEVELDAPSPDAVTLTWETVDTGSATPGVDFTPGAGTVTLQPGETRGAIVVSLLNDEVAEGPESFDVRFTGANGARLGEVSRVPVFITDDDNLPIARPDLVGTPVDTPVDVAVLANDSDPDGDPVSLTAVGTPGHGTADVAGSIVTYTPGPGFQGVDHFLYAISDGNGHTANGLISVYVGDPPPGPPVLTVTPAFLDFGTVPRGKTKDLVVTVTNDTAQPVALAGVVPVEQTAPQPFDVSDFDGCLSLGARVLDPGESCTQKVRFWSVPEADAASPATARFLHGESFATLATVVFFASTGPPVTGPNLPPVAVDDLTGVAPGFTHTLDAIRNDSDPDHDILRITAVSDPPHGTADVIACNSFPQNPNADCVRYVPDAGYTGIDAFTYAVSDGRDGSASATFHLAVGTVVPQVAAITPASGPTAGGQAVRITGSGFVHRSAVDFICPGGVFPLDVKELTDTEIRATTPFAPAGVCALRVRTLFGREGQLANAYRYSDAPVAGDAQVSTDEATPVTLTLPATDPNGDALAFSIVAPPAHGALSAITVNQVTYTPAEDYHGPDAFTFKANDGVEDSNVATVTITVLQPANDPPLASDDGPFSVLAGDMLTLPAPGVLANDADLERAALTARFVTAPAHGVLFLRPSGGFDYTPSPGYVGPDSFTYVANDGRADSNVAMVSLVVHPRLVAIEVTEAIHVNDGGTVDPAVMIEVAEAIHVSDGGTVQTSPRADDAAASTPEDTPVLVTPSATDADGDPFTLTIVSGPAHGTVFPPPGVAIPGGTPVTYTPAGNYFGADSFTFKATDSQGDSNEARVTIVVAPVPDAPVAAPDGPYFVTEGGTLTEHPPSVLLNDFDPDLEPLTARAVTSPAHGTLALRSDGGFTYTPAPRYFGSDTFTYVANDGLLDSSPATVVIQVRPAPGHEVTTGAVPPGGTLTTDTEGDGATLEDAIETTVSTPQGGDVTIDDGPAPPPLPTAWTFLPLSAEITAPAGAPSQPLLLTFLIDGRVVSAAGGTPQTLRVFRNGFEVPPCRPGSSATPDPCVSLRQMADDDVRLAVRTSRASLWTFGVPRSTSGLATGALSPRSGGSVAFAATRIHGQLVGALTYQKGSERFLAVSVSAFAVEDDGHTAWFAGLGVDGRAFLAYAKDQGATGDLFRVWIGGVDKTGDGRLASGHTLVVP